MLKFHCWTYPSRNGFSTHDAPGIAGVPPPLYGFDKSMFGLPFVLCRKLYAVRNGAVSAELRITFRSLMSQNTPYPPRNTVFGPKGVYAKPKRGENSFFEEL